MPRTLPTLAALLLAPAMLVPLTGLTPHAHGQIAEASPYQVVVTASPAPLRSGDLERFYKVAELPQGTILTVTGESASWLRVQYPAGVHAAVRADEAERRGNTIVLTVPSKLRAINLTAGFPGSWKSVLPEALPAGTSLSLVSVSTGSDGSIEGFIVQPPAGAAAYIGASLVRKATPEEIASAAAVLTTPPAPAPTPAPEAQEVAPSAPVTPTEPVSEEVQTRAQAVEQALSAPIAPEGATPGSPNATTPPEPSRISQMFSLEDDFERVRQQPLETAELDPLIERFELAIAELTDSPRDQRVRQRLEHRLNILTLRRDYRDRLAAAQQSASSTQESVKATEQRLEQFRNSLEFDHVGRITPSAIYNGRNLPLMYRLEAINADGSAGSTIGYLPAWPELKLDGLVGRTVGIAGTVRYDSERKLRVIDPLRIDPMD